MYQRPILQLEDDENDVMFLEFAFKGAGITNPVVIARDGEQAIAYLKGLLDDPERRRREIPQLAILDLKTPRRTGFEVLRWIRAQPQIRTMVTIVLSASGSQSDVDNAYAEGANAFLVKPAGLDKLTEMMRAVQAFWLEHNQFASGLLPGERYGDA